LGRYDSPNANAALSQRLTIEEDANVIKELNAALRILE
jgi:hypothetical protein